MNPFSPNPFLPDPGPSREMPFTLHQVVDYQHRNVVASVFEYPAGWQAQNDLRWNFENMSFPANAYARAFNPQGAEAIEFLPAELFFWVEPNYGFYQQGQIVQQLQFQFNQYLQAGYSQILAAGQLSQAISANNDAMLSAFEQQRHAAWHSHSSVASNRSASEGFDEYIRGVETVEDPYYGESQQDANYLYHWTDGYGNYQHTDDPFFNPNIGSAQDWTFMEPKKR